MRHVLALLGVMVAGGCDVLWSSFQKCNPDQPGSCAADDMIIIGQPDNPAPPGPTDMFTGPTLSRPRSVASDGDRLVISDEGNHRVLIWPHIPKNSQEAVPILVLGQPNLHANSANGGGKQASAGSLNNPQGVFISGQSLVVADSDNNRILTTS